MHRIFSKTLVLKLLVKVPLGAVIDSEDFKSEYVCKKITNWTQQIIKLTEYSKTQLHAAYAIFCRGVLHKYTYFMRAIQDIDEHLKPLDDIISSNFLPTLLDFFVTDNEQSLFQLLVRLGGLGIPILSEVASEHFESSKKITAPLITIMILQGDTLTDGSYIKTLKLKEKMKHEDKFKIKAAAIKQLLSPAKLRAVSDAKDPGASNWLFAVLLEEYNFILNKKEFCDAMNLRYRKDLKGLPFKFPCGQSFNMTYALNCKTGGFITIRHNRVRDFEAQLLTEICNDVGIKPLLQPLGEIINSLTGVNAKPDVCARGFWQQGQNAFFNVRITNTNSESQSRLTSENIFTKHEREKKRLYNNRMMNVEHGTCTPLVFSVDGGMAKECLKFHKLLLKRS